MMSPKIQDTEIENIKEMHKNGDSFETIAKHYGVKHSTISRFFKRHNLKSRTLEESTRRYPINKDYFNQIDSHEKAQILGFIYADGCISGEKTEYLIIHLAIKDLEYLEAIKKRLGFGGNIRIIPKRKASYQDACFLRICSKTFIKNLKDKGVTQRKSLVIKFPSIEQVPEEYISSFILGYFEGDGSISIARKTAVMSFVGTLDFVSKIKEHLNKRVNVTGSIFPQEKIYKYQIMGNQQVKAALSYLYSEASFFMNRKHERYESYFKDLEPTMRKFSKNQYMLNLNN